MHRGLVLTGHLLYHDLTCENEINTGLDTYLLDKLTNSCSVLLRHDIIQLPHFLGPLLRCLIFEALARLFFSALLMQVHVKHGCEYDRFSPLEITFYLFKLLEN